MHIRHSWLMNLNVYRREICLLGQFSYVRGIPMVTLIVHNKPKFLVSKNKGLWPINMTYDNFICVYSMTFDLEECVQTAYPYQLHRPTG